MSYDDEAGDPLDRSDWEQREIYAHFGLAIYFCQVLETGIVNYLMFLHRATAGEEMTEAEVDELFAELFGRTFGRNIRSVRKILGDEGTWILEDQMAEALELRNELVHHWMRTRSLRQGTSTSRLAMIDELKEAISRLEDADRVLGERTRSMLRKAGFDNEMLLTENQRLTDLAERGEPDPDEPEYFSVKKPDQGGPASPG